MTSTKHTQGLWATDEADHDTPFQNINIQASNHTICTVWIDDAPVRDFNSEQQANARRIIACVNACNGFSIEEIDGADLFKDSIESCNLIDELQAQRDELLSLLTEVAGNFTRYDDLPDNMLPRIDATIAKVKGK